MIYYHAGVILSHRSDTIPCTWYYHTYVGDTGCSFETYRWLISVIWNKTYCKMSIFIGHFRRFIQKRNIINASENVWLNKNKTILPRTWRFSKCILLIFLLLVKNGKIYLEVFIICSLCLNLLKCPIFYKEILHYNLSHITENDLL